MRPRTCTATLLAVISLVLVAACRSSSPDAGTAGAGANTFGLSEFSITPPTNELDAGDVTITANNVGGEAHELVIVRAEDVASLPTKADGSVDEDANSTAAKVAELDDIAAGSQKRASFVLTAGDYVAYCNLVDSMTRSSSSIPGDEPMDHGSGHDAEMSHVHFAEGMSVPFSVR